MNQQLFRCPVCGNPSSPAWTKSDFEIFKCDTCPHMFCIAGQQQDYVERTYADDYFEGGGGGYSDYLQHKNSLVASGRRYAKLLQRHADVGRVLDIGAAAGFILEGLVAEGWTGIGIEPNQKMAEIASNAGLDVREGNFEDVGSLDPFDAATIIQVISHLRDPIDCLKRVHGLLRPNGILLIETWNRISLTARIFGHSWHQYNPPSVLHWYTKPHLENMLEDCGFKVIARGRPTKWISVGNGVSLIRHSLRDSTLGRIAASPLAFVPKALKVPYFLDDVFWFVALRTD